jgi:hypothetical protein
LVAFGRRKPKELLLAIDELFVLKERRLQALSLLSSFVRLQPPHLHLVLETKVIQHLHTCLLVDKSSTVVDIASTILIMFIPHITSSLVTYLPTLFVIYARLLCWDQYQRKPNQGREESSDSEHASEPEGAMTLEHDPEWDPIEFSPASEPTLTPKTTYLFTFLYGLFPLNFMAFIRTPKRYLKMKGFANADDLELHQTLIRSRSEIHRSQHRLHPNFFVTTPEEELADNKWVKSDPSDLVSECLGLSIALTFSMNDPGPPPTAKLPPLPKKIRKQPSRVTIPFSYEETLGSLTGSPIDDVKPQSSQSNRNTLSTSFTGHSSTTYANTEHKIPRQASSTNLADSNIARGSRAPSPQGKHLNDFESSDLTPTLVPNTVNSPSGSPPRSAAATPIIANPKLQVFAQVLSRFPMPNPGNHGAEAYSTVFLQRELMLIKNELTFEKFQKQKYLEQIGHFQRKNMNEATVEADTQGLMNTNRNLKARLARTDERYEQLKRETSARTNQAKKAEDQLTAKIKTIKEEEKRLSLENESLRRELEQARKECEDLRSMIVNSEQTAFQAQNQLEGLQQDAAEVETLRTNLIALSERLHQYEDRDLEYARAQEEFDVLRSELETQRLKLNSSNSERERLRVKYEQRIYQLEADLTTAVSVASASPAMQPGQQLPASVQQMVDSALAASQSKITQLRKQYATLQHRYLELEIRNQELETTVTAPRPGSVLSLTRFADDFNLPSSGTSSARESYLNSTLPSRSRSVLRQSGTGAPRHDFAPPVAEGAPLMEEDGEDDGSIIPLEVSPPLEFHQGLSMFSPQQQQAPQQKSSSQQQPPSSSRSANRGSPNSITNSERDLHAALGQAHDFNGGARAAFLAERAATSSGGYFSGVGDGGNGTPAARVYGRGKSFASSVSQEWMLTIELGGAGNVNKKTKDKDVDKKVKPTKTGTFRSFKGII